MIMDKESPDEEKCNQNGVLSERKITFQIDATVKDEREGAVKGVQVGSIQQPSPSQGTGVCWERFLHVRSIRVLLVENDDCTRHVVTALLRNCNYEVINAANGLQAWKILEDLNNQVDIVLTEVVMPCISGVALLYKIMSHKTRKNIPVIMMSSHDSMGLVFKCLSKGAVDFLVKPIRKNELKNLWQHVWRRCHSSSGSGSESGTQTQKSVKSKISEKAADNSGSDDGENNGSNGLNVGGDGSDDGSGTQSSWTKQAVEVDSSQAMSPIDQLAECPDSTCAQVIRPNAENSANKRVDNSLAHEKTQPDTVGQGKDLETIISRNVESKSENQNEIPVIPMGAKPKSLSGLDCNMSSKQQVDEGAIAKMSIPLIDGKESGLTREVTSILDIKNTEIDDCKEPNFELSLKRLRGVQDIGRSVQDDRCVVRRSEQSAFSRYNTSSNVFKPPNGGLTGSGSIIDNSIEVAKLESVGDIQIQAHSNGVISNNNIDMGSTTNKLCVPHCHNYYHRHCHHLLNSEDKQPSSYDNNEKKLAADPPQCGSPNVLSGQIESNVNRSASGSNFGSNGQINGSSTAINAVGTNTESDFGQAGKSGGSGDGSGIGNGVDENKMTHREAALNKFRQKRKERCFKKKVRYQNRKKLAEQRPRVRGQFVKQSGTDSSNRTEDE